MTDEEKQELHRQICNDINCGTFYLAPQFVESLIKRKNKKLKRIVKRTVLSLQKLEKNVRGVKYERTNTRRMDGKTNT